MKQEGFGLTLGESAAELVVERSARFGGGDDVVSDVNEVVCWTRRTRRRRVGRTGRTLARGRARRA